MLSQTVLDLVGGESLLVADAPEVLMNQPVGFLAPKSAKSNWAANGTTEIHHAIQSAIDFSCCWAVPFLDQVKSLDDVLWLYEQRDQYQRDDQRVAMQRHFYIQIAAAYLHQGQRGRALEVARRHLGSPGLRRRYAAVFRELTGE
ncbi:MAG: hypothetical protein AAF577_12440 [Pseudomonadota bacterium]